MKKGSRMRIKMIVPLNTKLDSGREGGNALVGQSTVNNLAFLRLTVVPLA